MPSYKLGLCNTNPPFERTTSLATGLLRKTRNDVWFVIKTYPLNTFTPRNDVWLVIKTYQLNTFTPAMTYGL